MPSVLFVCTGNIARSPIASALFQRLVSTHSNAPTWRIESAGTWAAEGLPAAHNAQLALQAWGLDLSTHRSRRITGPLARSFALLLTMEHAHQEALRAEFSDIAARVYLLSEMAGQVQDVLDPLGGSLIDFRAAAQEIEQWLSRGIEQIVQLSAT